MIKLFQKSETDKYIIIKILFIQITFKKKPPKSDIDSIVWWIPFKNLRNAVRNIYYEHNNNFRQTYDLVNHLYPYIWDTAIKKGSEKNIQYLFYMFNKYKEELLKKKVKNKEKIKVLFIINYAAKFGMETIYSNMLESEIFEPYILVVHPRDEFFDREEIYFKEALENYNLFKERGYRTLFAYNIENKKPIDIDNLNADMIFINNPNMYNFSVFKNMNINIKHLVCYIDYSVCVVSDDEYTYENININSCYKVFSETYFHYRKNMDINNGINLVLTGYPKLDAYAKDIKKCKLPEKIDNGKKIIIYAPHWTLGNTSNRLGTFHLYHKYFINLLKQYPDINFVFKPHPDLRYRIIDSGILDIEYYENYIKEWDSSDNGIYIFEGEYIDLFRKSSLLITDSGSFIAEYLPSKNPCFFLINPEKENLIETTFNDFAKPILNSYYLCYDENDISEYFRKAILNENDYMKDKRIKLIEESFINIGSAGKTIVEYLSGIFND